MTKPKSREKAEKMAKEIVKEWYLDCIRCDRLVNAIADALTPQLELLAECERALALYCPPEFETATETFEPAGYDKGDCAGCGTRKDEHSMRLSPHQQLSLLAKIKEVGK